MDYMRLVLIYAIVAATVFTWFVWPGEVATNPNPGCAICGGASPGYGSPQ